MLTRDDFLIALNDVALRAKYPDYEAIKCIKAHDAALRARVEALEQALDGIVDVIRVLYNMDRIYPTSHEEQLALEAKLGLAYQQALAQREERG